MSSVGIISRYKFVSAADEKVIRTFQAPLNFVENFKRICKIQDDVQSYDCGPEGAAVPSLGLSNKAVFTNDQKQTDENFFSPVIMNEPPTEEALLQNTLWPETQKLYGHGYEVYCLAASPDGAVLASACKATTVEHAAIILWETGTWSEIQRLQSHSLTVAQLCFSPNSQNLLSVSRDRRWSLFRRVDGRFEMAATVDKKTAIHTRIIWCCGFTHDSLYFGTGSRDGRVVIWGMKDGGSGEYRAASQALELINESVTALAFAPDLVSGDYLIAIGFESGVIQFYKWSPIAWQSILILDKSLAHHLTVKRLAFRPLSGNAPEDDKRVQLASCSSDNSLVVHNLFVQ